MLLTLPSSLNVMTSMMRTVSDPIFASNAMAAALLCDPRIGADNDSFAPFFMASTYLFNLERVNGIAVQKAGTFRRKLSVVEEDDGRSPTLSKFLSLTATNHACQKLTIRKFFKMCYNYWESFVVQ